MVTPVSPEGGRGVRVEVEWRALGEAGQWSLCATRLLLYSVPLVVRDGAIVLAAPLLESDKILFQKVREAKWKRLLLFRDSDKKLVSLLS